MTLFLDITLFVCVLLLMVTLVLAIGLLGLQLVYELSEDEDDDY